MRSPRTAWPAGLTVVAAGALTVLGCFHTPVPTSEYDRGPAPLRMPSPAAAGSCCYEDSLTGGQVFEMYCSYCHYAPALAERPFANFKNVATHMRIRANLTGKEYAKLMAFLRRWHDVPPPHPPVEPGPTRFTYPQPIAELRPPEPKKDNAADQSKQEKLPPPRPGP